MILLLAQTVIAAGDATQMKVHVPKFFGSTETLPLLACSQHSFVVARARSALMLARIQAVSLFLSALTLAWTVIDYLEFTSQIWRIILIERLVTGAAFFGLSKYCSHSRSQYSERSALAILFAVPLVFLLSAETSFQANGMTNTSLTGAAAYYYLPFVVAAGLAIFPLTALEGAMLGMAILGTMIISMSIWPRAEEFVSPLGTLWRLFVIASICSFAGICQLQLLIRVTERASHDGLTGALTRQSGELLLEMGLARANRYNEPFAVAFADLDRFKLVNDRFGHEVGDTVLKQATERMRDKLRGHDALIRWGGEEFLLVFAHTTSGDAESVLERLGASGLCELPDGARQTASIGLAERISDGQSDPSALIDLADERLYAAKEAGRNRLVNCAEKAKILCTLDAPTTAAATWVSGSHRGNVNLGANLGG